MTVEETYLKGCFVLSQKAIGDSRGNFFETFNQHLFNELTGGSIVFVQDNQSKSSKGVLRGLHFQTEEYAQAKLVRVIRGKVLDVCVDLRADSKSFGKYFSIILDDKNNKQLFIPKDFAHGFLALEDNTIFSYKCDNYYNKSSERGIIYNDPSLRIDWNFPENEILLSEKDKNLPAFETLFK
jgi:dTDP-4-dehydrorhamnose 3,5-epimerase